MRDAATKQTTRGRRYFSRIRQYNIKKTAKTSFSRQEAKSRYPTLANFLPKDDDVHRKQRPLEPGQIIELRAVLLGRMYHKATYKREARTQYLELRVPFIEQLVPAPFRLYFDERGMLEHVENDNKQILPLNQSETFLVQALWHTLLSD